MMRQPDPAPRKARVDPPLLLAFLLPLFAVAALAYPGYFELRSGFLPIFALSDRLARLTDLGWTPAVGVAHSVLAGDGPLPYWLAVLPSALAAEPYAAIKWVLAGALVTGSVGALCWLRTRWPDGWASLVGAAVYVLNPLTLSLVYREGALAAVVLLAMLPWMFWAVERAAVGSRRGLFALAVLVAAAIWTQAGLGLAQVVILVAYILVRHQSAAGETKPDRSRPSAKLRRPVRSTLSALAAGLALGVLLWLPALLAHGFGVAPRLPFVVWLALGLPWLALLAGWVAAQLGELLEPEQGDLRPALYGSLLALVLLLAYGEPAPVELPAPVPAAPLAIFGENDIALIGVSTEGTPGPGGRVTVKATWQALRPLGKDYTVFFHVVGPDGQRYGQQDGMPQQGQAPTSGWPPGRLIVDEHEAILAPDAPISGSYQYWLGFYDGATGARLSTGRDDKFVVPQGN